MQIKIKDGNKPKPKYFLIALLLLLAGSNLFLAWITWTITVDPLNRAYEYYNHIQLYEDGSFSGADREGNRVTGCVTGGLCKD